MNKLNIKNIIAIIATALCLGPVCLNLLGITNIADTTITLLVLLMASVFLVTEVLPLAVGAMTVPLVLAISGILSVKTAFSGFSNDNVILFGAMFIVGGALFRTGVASAVGELVVKLANGRKDMLIIYIMVVTAVLSSVMSNTGTVAVLVPVCIGIADSAKMDRKSLLIPLAFMSSLGGMITLVGTPPNLTVSTVLAEYGYRSFGFLEYAYTGIPLCILGGLYMFIYYRKELSKGGNKVDIPDTTHTEQFTIYGKIATVILIGVVIVMATGIMNLTLGAAIGAMLCLLFKLQTPHEVIEDIDWTTIFLFAGMLPLSNALEVTGAGKMIADMTVSLIGGNGSIIVISTVLFLIGNIMTQFMSNTAACALLAPIGIEIAVALGVDPKPILLIISIGCCAAFATPMATPPNTLVMGPSNAQFSDYIKVGLPLIILCYIGCILLVQIFFPF